MDEFLRTTLPRIATPIHRLGLSASYWPGKAAIYRALDEGLNYFFLYGFDRQMVTTLRDVLPRERERYVVATGAYNYIWWRQDLRRALEKRLQQLRTDYIDVFQFLGVMKPAEFTARVRDQLEELRHDGRVRSVAISCHDRKFAAELAANGTLDTIMIRYNAAHRGAEQDVFPKIEGKPCGVASYTATRWGYLVRRPRGWPSDRRIPTAGQCYRFALSHPQVNVCLTAPRNLRQLEENIAAVKEGPLSPEEMAFLREFGDEIYRRHKRFL
jgi:aryl-alcohol dehydrogenase-like predicted oxidoreductase